MTYQLVKVHNILHNKLCSLYTLLVYLYSDVVRFTILMFAKQKYQ
jgi:hypothetical protein